MANTLQLDIVTPDNMVLSAAVEYVSAPGVEGEFGVLPGHSALLAALGVGCLGYVIDGVKKCAFVAGGFAEVLNDKITILAESSELAENIDEARAKEALKRAENRLHSHSEEVDVDRARAALSRAIMRVSVRGRGIM